MSLSSRLASNTDAQRQQDSFLAIIKRNRAWLMTYIALVTSLLAFFIFIISWIELEGSTSKRNYQKLLNEIYQQLNYEAKQQGIDWLNIENTLTKGVRISLTPDLIANQNLFSSARAKLNPRYLPYLQQLALLLQQLDIANLKQRHNELIAGMETPELAVRMMLKIEGHTDAQPLAATAKFVDNIELSTFRAYAMMDWLRIHLPLPRKHFMIAGYGSFKPLLKDKTAAQNRRIEIYIVPQLLLRNSVGGEL